MTAAPPAALALLEAASLIRPGESASEAEYRFKHTLIQETAYAGLLRERRIELHRQVAEAILLVHPEAAMVQPAVLAFHYYHGGDDDRAFRFALRAGHLARRNYAHAEAVANYDLALEVAPRLASTALTPQIREAFIGKGTALEISGHHPEAQRVYRSMETFARETGTRPWRRTPSIGWPRRPPSAATRKSTSRRCWPGPSSLPGRPAIC